MVGWGWEAHRYCYRGLEASLLGLSLHRGVKRTDTQTLQDLGKVVLAPESGWGTRAGAVWHLNKGSPVQEDWALAWRWKGKRVSCRVHFPKALGSNLLLSITTSLPPRNEFFWWAVRSWAFAGLALTASAGRRLRDLRAAEGCVRGPGRQIGPEAERKGVATTDNTIFTKIIRQKGRATQPDP